MSKESRIYGCSAIRLSKDDKKYYFDRAISIQRVANMNGVKLPWKTVAKRLGLKDNMLYKILKSYGTDTD